MKRVQVFPAIVLIAAPETMQKFTSLRFDKEKPPGTRRVDRSKVFVLNNTIYVGVSTPEGPQLVFKEALESYEDCGDQHNALTVSGKIVAFRKDDNCGCGTTLKGWSPFGNSLSSTKDPDA